ncbi:catalytic inositol polyphosphate 5-phosphatase (INPP5c) [Olene mendosa nucleopolyhedrovirus]|uniref:Catalytic inositol polyphosphate 5-phosphatase (INPP5c) n=1 Tax=Olene mendosa nucleopolyhedrovirus TaxID=2933796 RepID=A0AAX3AUE6_9ABAC|nr:catalytic inositol polyphosphate 5-phosphatase (INPP5c) [Olene mendosa nucleopolyhedrovirus]UOQ18929.1 catalytic inositol polyphosphate 5-phosphatase (INPP5c) [Olene mendosa nucleopolyhedrovirus]
MRTLKFAMSYKYYFNNAPFENDERFIFKGIGDVERPRRKLSLKIAVYDAKNQMIENARALTTELIKLKIHFMFVQNPHIKKINGFGLWPFTKGEYGRICFSEFKKIKLGRTTVLLINAKNNHDECQKLNSREEWLLLSKRLIMHHYDCFPNKARTIVVCTCPPLGKDVLFRELIHGGYSFDYDLENKDDGSKSLYTDKLSLFCIHHKLKMVNTFVKNLQTRDDRELILAKHIDAIELKYRNVCDLRMLIMDACMEEDQFDFDYIPRQPLFTHPLNWLDLEDLIKKRRYHYKKTLTKLGLSKLMSQQRQFLKLAMSKYLEYLNNCRIDTNEKDELQDFIRDLLPYHY